MTKELHIGQKVTILDKAKQTLIGKGVVEKLTTIGAYINGSGDSKEDKNLQAGFNEWFSYSAFSFI